MPSDSPSIERQLDSAYRQIRYWDQHADDLVARSIEMRALADRIEDDLAPLLNVLDPIHDLHTEPTWEGSAATQSRRRLDAHHDRSSHAITTTRNLIDDLRDDSRSTAREADTARANEQRHRRTASRLEVELGALDDVYM